MGKIHKVSTDNGNTERTIRENTQTIQKENTSYRTSWYQRHTTVFSSRHKTKSIHNGFSFSPFIFHSKCISCGARSFWDVEKEKSLSVDTEKIQIRTWRNFQIRLCQQHNVEFRQLYIFLIAFPHVTISLLAVRHWDTRKGICLFSASSFYSSHGAGAVVQNPLFAQGPVVQASPCVHLNHRHILDFCGLTHLPPVSPKSSNRMKTAHSHSFFYKKNKLLNTVVSMQKGTSIFTPLLRPV